MNLYDNRQEDALKMYSFWKELINIQRNYDYRFRAIPVPQEIGVLICSYVNRFYLSERFEKYDAYDPGNNKKIGITLTSNWNRDFTRITFPFHYDELHFCRLNVDEDTLYIYKFTTEQLLELLPQIEKDEEKGKVTRISLIHKLIEPYRIEPYNVTFLSEKDRWR